MKKLLPLCICATLLLSLNTGVAQGQATNLAIKYVQDNAAALGLTADDVSDMAVSDAYTSQHNGVTHVYLQQQYQRVGVFNALINAHVTRDNRVFVSGNAFVPNLAENVAGGAGLSPTAAVEVAAGHLGLTITEPLTVLSSTPGPSQGSVVSRGGISLEDISAELVYQPLENGEVRLAWNVAIYTLDAQHWWSMRIDAGTGVVLDQNDWVVQDDWGEPLPLPGRASEETASKNALAGSYRVFGLPLESPNHGPRTLEVDPDNATASPFGWHDTNGSPGAEFTVTRGNNAHAYTDLDANNVPDPGSDPDGGGGLAFDFPLDLAMGPETYRDAAVTNLFYWNNIIHDVLYQYGFDEASGNFQENNYGNGGSGSDYVSAEAQDGSGTNNANFLTLPDGFNPRMQMFRWLSPFPNELDVGTPVNEVFQMTGANFGPTFDASGVTGTLVLADDGTGTTSDGCEPLINGGAVSGNIALIDRGDCNFTIKVLNAQAVGATAVVIVNNVPGQPITLGGTDATIVIPSGMISMDDGDTIKAAGAGVQGTARNAGATVPDRDSDLDNGIIVHEYGHGISNRLTGGPANVDCLDNDEQAGEGWSDFYAMMLTQQMGDAGPDARGVGTYVIYQSTNGAGIRARPYSTSLGVNEFTYDTIIGTGTSPHALGHVWATMIWDMTWALIGDPTAFPGTPTGDNGAGGGSGFNSNFYLSGTDPSAGGNNLAIQLVTDGMKLQPCSPGFVDARNGILLADEMITTGADLDPLTPDGRNACAVWTAFARRGLGLSADQGSPFDRTDGTEAFDLPPGACGPPGPITRYIDPTGNDTGNNCTNPASPCATVGHAVSEANDGDTLDIAAGDYVEPGLVIEKDLDVQGAGVIIR